MNVYRRIYIPKFETGDNLRISSYSMEFIDGRVVHEVLSVETFVERFKSEREFFDITDQVKNDKRFLLMIDDDLTERFSELAADEDANCRENELDRLDRVFKAAREDKIA